jgi:muramoyltetrapeptide carboxypeptidase
MAEKRKGRSLRPGSLIAVPTPGSRLLDPKYLESGFGWLEVQGFRVRLTEHANIGASFKAGHPGCGERCAQCVRRSGGGCGLPSRRRPNAGSQVLPYLDYDLIAAHPKPFVAFSELTVLHAALVGNAGLVTLYGPMVSALGVFPDSTRRSWLQALTTTAPLGVLDAEGTPAQTVVPRSAMLRQRKSPPCGAFAEPSDGLEPSTPSLP